MEDNKAWYQSRGVWGGLVAVGAGLAGLFGYSFAPDAQAALVDNLVTVASSVVAVVGGVVAVWGRVKAAKKVG